MARSTRQNSSAAGLMYNMGEHGNLELPPNLAFFIGVSKSTGGSGHHSLHPVQSMSPSKRVTLR